MYVCISNKYVTSGAHEICFFRHQNKYLYGMYCTYSTYIDMIHTLSVPHTFELVRCHAALLSSKQVKIQCKRVFNMVFCLVFKYIFYTTDPSIRITAISR